VSAAHLADVKTLLNFLVPSLPAVKSCGVAYDNMAALLADVSLQAGLNYERTVWPRVAEILRRYPDCNSTCGLVSVLQRTSVHELLRWNGQDKILRFKALLGLFVELDIQSIEDLAIWIEATESREALLNIRGVGKKTVDYLRILCGNVAFPLDRHFMRFLRMAGVDATVNGYDYVQRLLLDACSELGLNPRETEKGLWLLLRACS
jgi:endonuclease III